MPNRNTFFKRRRTHPGDPTVVHPHGLEWRGHCVGFGLAQESRLLSPLVFGHHGWTDKTCCGYG